MWTCEFMPVAPLQPFSRPSSCLSDSQIGCETRLNTLRNWAKISDWNLNSTFPSFHPSSLYLSPPPSVLVSVRVGRCCGEKSRGVNSLSPCLINTVTHPASRHPLLHPRSTLPFPPRLRPFNLADDFLGPRPPGCPEFSLSRLLTLFFFFYNFSHVCCSVFQLSEEMSSCHRAM